MNKEELIGKLQMVYVGERNALNEMIDYYDELFDEMSNWREEAKELKKQLEKNQNPLKGIFAQVNDDILLRDCGNMNAEINELKNQQKEFIKYLEDYLKLFDKMDIDAKISYDMFEEILQKYKEIIGE